MNKETQKIVSNIYFRYQCRSYSLIPLLRPHIVGWLKLYLVNSNDNLIKKVFPFIV